MDDQRERSGDFSQDPDFDPDQLFRVIESDENAKSVSEAMRTFLVHGERDVFERAIAVFVRSAKARQEPIERVLAVLIELAGQREGAGYPHDLEPSELRRLVLRGVLFAFYGDSAGPGHSGVERRKRPRSTDASPPK